MKSLSDFTKKSKVAEANITKDKFYKNEVYKRGEWVITEQGNVGKIHRRGPNYVLCLTAENTKFRSWIKDIKEVFEIGTDAYREYVMSITPGQKVAKPSNTVKVKETIPSKHPLNKMDKHEEKSLADLAADNLNNPKAFNYNRFDENWRYDYSAKMANTDIKGLGADGVGGGDAPGMKLAEPKGEEGKPTIKKVKHSCATKVEHPEWGAGNCLKGEHTLHEDGTVTHYDVMFEHGLEKDVPVADMAITKEGMHEHAARPERHQDEIGSELPVDESPLVEPAIKNEHHQKDADGKVIEHEDEKIEEGKKAKKDYDGDGKVESGKDEYFGSRDKAIKKAMGKKAMKKEETVEEASLATARKNIGRDPKKPSCWKGYKAKGTKMKGGKSVPNCVKEFSEWRAIAEKK